MKIAVAEVNQARSLAVDGKKYKVKVLTGSADIFSAGIEGATVGDEVAWTLACDWRVAAENATIYLPEAKVGLNMGWSAIPRMVNLIGAPRTKRAILLAERLGMQQALEWGLIDDDYASRTSARPS